MLRWECCVLPPRILGNKEFQDLCIEQVKEYIANKYKVDIKEEEVYIVWYCKTLQNHKALVSTDKIKGHYFECTYNGDKQELYIDPYVKLENICISLAPQIK